MAAGPIPTFAVKASDPCNGSIVGSFGLLTLQKLRRVVKNVIQYFLTKILRTTSISAPRIAFFVAADCMYYHTHYALRLGKYVHLRDYLETIRQSVCQVSGVTSKLGSRGLGFE